MLHWWILIWLSHLLLLLSKLRLVVVLLDHLRGAARFEKSVQLLVIQVVEVSVRAIQDEGLAWFVEVEFSTNSADLEKQKSEQC